MLVEIWCESTGWWNLSGQVFCQKENLRSAWLAQASFLLYNYARIIAQAGPGTHKSSQSGQAWSECRKMWSERLYDKLIRSSQPFNRLCKGVSLVPVGAFLSKFQIFTIAFASFAIAKSTFEWKEKSAPRSKFIAPYPCFSFSFYPPSFFPKPSIPKS